MILAFLFTCWFIGALVALIIKTGG